MNYLGEPKCNDKCPFKRETKRALSTEKKVMYRNRDWNDMTTCQRVLASKSWKRWYVDSFLEPLKKPNLSTS
jgi:hypothetical protein